MRKREAFSCVFLRVCAVLAAAVGGNHSGDSRFGGARHKIEEGRWEEVRLTDWRAVARGGGSTRPETNERCSGKLRSSRRCRVGEEGVVVPSRLPALKTKQDLTALLLA